MEKPTWNDLLPPDFQLRGLTRSESIGLLEASGMNPGEHAEREAAGYAVRPLRINPYSPVLFVREGDGWTVRWDDDA